MSKQFVSKITWTLVQDSANWSLPLQFSFSANMPQPYYSHFFGHDICFYFVMKIWRKIDPRSPKLPSFCPPTPSLLSQKASYVSFLLSKSGSSIRTIYLLPSPFFREGLAQSMFWQTGGVCILKSAFLLWEELKNRGDFLYSGVREESSKEEEGSVMGLRVHATEHNGAGLRERPLDAASQERLQRKEEQDSDLQDLPPPPTRVGAEVEPTSSL